MPNGVMEWIMYYVLTKMNSFWQISYKSFFILKGGSRHKNWCKAKVLGFLIWYFSNYYTLHRSDLAARAAPLDPRLILMVLHKNKKLF